jgi:uncharacterized Zn-binding protein involved in type VI secretion
MGAPAVVMGDRIMATCVHPVPAAAGAPVPTPMPFSSPLLDGLASSVLIGGKPAAVLGSAGLNVPPHVGITDAFSPPNLQRGTVLGGSATVLFEGKPAARTGSPSKACIVPGTLTGTGTTVLIGG